MISIVSLNRISFGISRLSERCYDYIMIIVLGGFVYNGRHILARHLAGATGGHLYPVGDKKLRQPGLSRKGVLIAGVKQPNSDEEYDALYNKIAADLPMLVKLHDTVIIDDVFQREAPRERFLAAAKRLDRTIFIWIDSPDETVASRVPYLQKIGVVKDEADAYRKLEARKSQMQFFMPPLIFMHRISNRSAADRLKKFIDFVISRGFVRQ